VDAEQFGSASLIKRLAIVAAAALIVAGASAVATIGAPQSGETRGVIVGLGFFGACLLYALAMIWHSQRHGVPWVTTDHYAGLVPLVALFMAGAGMLVALVSMLLLVG